MSRNRIILLIGLALLVAIVVLALNQRSRFSWRENYQQDNKQPYGTFVLHELLAGYTPASELIDLRDSLSGELPSAYGAPPANYFFVGEGLFMRPSDLEALLGFVDAGNTAFISCKTPPFDLMFHLYYDECTYAPWEGTKQYVNDTVRLNFSHPRLRHDSAFTFVYTSRHRPATTYWPYIGSDYFCDLDEGLEPLGFLNDSLVNLVRVPWGEGWFYLHTTPQVLTNFFLVTEAGRQYAERALSHLNAGPIYWDEYSRIPERMARNLNPNQSDSERERRLESQGPLQYVLEQPPLAWAWYLLLTAGLLYLIFRAKRRQRVIPVLAPNRNTSLQFVQNVGRWYFQKSSHQQVAVQAIRLLRNFVWERYALQWRDDEAFAQQLAARSGVDPALIQEIGKNVKNIPRYTGLVETELVKFHQRLERFYQTAK